MGLGFGLMVIKDSFRNKILWYKFVRNETIADYWKGIAWLHSNGFIIHGIVCDGLRGLFFELRTYRVQMCQFHQAMIVKRYLTRNPELADAVELLEISNSITHIDKENFIGSLNAWYSKWEQFLKERRADTRTGRTSYTHLRSAYLRLKRNMP